MPTQQWVYRGKRGGVNVATVDAYTVLNDDGTIQPGAKEPAFKEMKKLRRVVGGVYTVEAFQKDDTETYGVMSAKFLHMFHDADMVARWKLESDAHLTLITAKKAESKADSLACLEPLRRMYAQTYSARERRAMEVLVLGYMRGEK